MYIFAKKIMLILNLKSMKKVFFAVAIACVAFAFSSCKDSSEARCWKVTYKQAGVEVVTYTWMSEDSMNATYGKFTDFKSEKVPGSQNPVIAVRPAKDGFFLQNGRGQCGLRYLCRHQHH